VIRHRAGGSLRRGGYRCAGSQETEQVSGAEQCTSSTGCCFHGSYGMAEAIPKPSLISQDRGEVGLAISGCRNGPVIESLQLRFNELKGGPPGC
jgi:hypothetical protein